MTVEPDRLASAGLHQGDLELPVTWGWTRVVPAVDHFTIPRSQRETRVEEDKEEGHNQQYNREREKHTQQCNKNTFIGLKISLEK